MKYFAYGSNMFTYRLEKRVGKVEIIGVCKLPRYCLQFNKVSVDSSLKANITTDDNDDVFGVLFEINPNKKDELDKAEGLGKGYRINEIEVEQIETNEKTRAFTYVAEKIDNSNANKPYDWYLQLITIGAEEHNLPEEYVNRIKSVSTKEDNNLFRKDSTEQIVNESKAIKKPDFGVKN